MVISGYPLLAVSSRFVCRGLPPCCIPQISAEALCQVGRVRQAQILTKSPDIIGRGSAIIARSLSILMLLGIRHMPCILQTPGGPALYLCRITGKLSEFWLVLDW